MKKLQIILLSLLTVSLIAHCPANSSGNGTQPPVDNVIPPTDTKIIRTIHVHVNEGVADNYEVVALADFFTVTTPTYSILEGNAANIFSIESSTGVITVADADSITYDAADKTNNIHLLKVQASDGSDSSKTMETPLRIVVRGFGGAFITTWTVPESSKTITIPTTTIGDPVYNYGIDWGDENTDSAQTGAATHTYDAAGTYTVRITGDFPRIYFNGDAASRNKILTVEQWGSIAWSSMESAFDGTSNLTVPAVDAPDLRMVSSMNSMFMFASTFNQNINHWDVSNVRDMRRLFNFAKAFNEAIGDWDTSKVTNMVNMFESAEAFNQDIGAWNTSEVTDMGAMFLSASAFNQDIGNWDTSKVINMFSMFSSASAFNQDIGAWNTAKVNSVGFMFENASAFNQNIRDWNVNAVTTCNNFASDSGLTKSNRPTFRITTCN